MFFFSLFTSNNAISHNMRPLIGIGAYVRPPTGGYGGSFHRLCRLGLFVLIENSHNEVIFKQNLFDGRK